MMNVTHARRDLLAGQNVMEAQTFNTHKTVKMLRATGFTEPQAEALVEALSEFLSVVRQNFATKAELKAELKSLELRLVLWMVGIMLTTAGLVVAAFFAIVNFFL